MLKSYLSNALRILAKDKLYTGINAAGLAIGLAICFLIYSWVRFETSYDTYFDDSERVYRVVTKHNDETGQGIASTYPMIKARVLPQFPEVEESARLFDQGFLGSKTKISHGDKVFTDNSFYYGDQNILKVFPFKVVRGNKATALDKVDAVILTQQAAHRFFGNEDPLGKTITIGENKDFEVTAVIENLPANIHFHFDVLASMHSHPWIKDAEDALWSGVVFHTYAKLKEDSDPTGLEKKIGNLLANFPDDPSGYGKDIDLRLQPIQDIHLYSNMKFELEANGNYLYIYLFVTIAILVLVVAIINYTNLATARHTQRFKEIAVRKVLGATRKQLIAQLVTESMVISLLAFVIAIFMVELARPVLIAMSGEEYFSLGLNDIQVLLAASGVSMLIGFLTGATPAFILSSLKPVKIFKANVSKSPKGITLRKSLVVFQFTISILLSICTAITYQQVQYMQGAKLGYDLDHTLVLNIGFPEILEKYETLKSGLIGHATITGATATSQLPSDVQTAENIDYGDSKSLGVNCFSVDPDFFQVMNIKVRQGQGLISSMKVSDSLNHFVLNEHAVKAIGWNEADALNEQISIRHGNQLPGPVMGVVDDFHFQSLHHLIGPLVIEFNPDMYEYLLVKVKPENLAETVNFIEGKWEEVAGGIPFDYMFLDQQYDRLYKSETQSGTLFIAFSLVAVFISLLGLFGLSSFAVERRTKEIGLRKILGASVESILLNVSRGFLFLLIISFLIALPLGYYFMDTWLSNFAFRTAIGPELYFIAGVFNILLGLLTITYHSLRVSKTNPVEALRQE